MLAIMRADRVVRDRRRDKEALVDLEAIEEGVSAIRISHSSRVRDHGRTSPG
jgi:hypothetical protein